MARIKVLIIDQMAVLQSERRKFAALARLDDLALSVVTPAEWRFNYRRIEFEKPEGPIQYNLIPLPVYAPGYGHRSFFSAGLKKVLDEIQPDIIHVFQEPYSFFCAQLAILRNLFHKKARLIFLTWQNVYFQHNPFFLSQLYTWIEKFTYRNFLCATPITHSALEVLKRRGFAKKTHIMRWGIDLERFKNEDSTSLRRALGLDNAFVIGFVGRFVEEKGIFDLLTAASSLKEKVHLLMVGDGPAKAALRKRVHSLGFDDRLTIVDSVSNSKMSAYLNCMDTLVLPSRDTKYWQEQLGKVLLEAMACEVPVIGSDSGEIPNVIADSGSVFQAGNAQDLKEKLAFVIDDKEGVEQLKHRALQRVHELYSWDAISFELLELYKDLPAH